MHVAVDVYVGMYDCMYACIAGNSRGAHTHTHTHTHIHTHAHAHAHAYTHMCVCVCIMLPGAGGARSTWPNKADGASYSPGPWTHSHAPSTYKMGQMLSSSPSPDKYYPPPPPLLSQYNILTF